MDVEPATVAYGMRDRGWGNLLKCKSSSDSLTAAYFKYAYFTGVFHFLSMRSNSKRKETLL